MNIIGRDRAKADKCMLSTIIARFNRGEYREDYKLQRNPGQWSAEGKSGLVASIIKSERIPAIVICEQVYDEDHYDLWLVDGLQRLTTLREFKNNSFALSKSLQLPIMKYRDNNQNIHEFDLRGKKYNDLPEELREAFDSYGIDITRYLECTDEEVAYHLYRHNIGVGMNTNQKNILTMLNTASYIKNIAEENSFWNDCSAITEKEISKNILNRVIAESVMGIFFLNDWKRGKTMCKYLDKNANEENFNTFNIELERLSEIVDKETTGTLFTSKNAFIWFMLFHEFVASYDLEDDRFNDFLNAFMNGLSEKALPQFNYSFDSYDAEKRATKDKTVVTTKFEMLKTLMSEYLGSENPDKIPVHTENSGNVEDVKASDSGVETGISLDENSKVAKCDLINQSQDNDESKIESTNKEHYKSYAYTDGYDYYSIKDKMTKEDIEEHIDFIENYLKSTSSFYRDCLDSLVALTTYAYGNDIDKEYGEWLNKYGESCEGRRFSTDQKTNFIYLRRAFDTYVNSKRSMGVA